MRFLGKKANLLPRIDALLRARGLEPPGLFLDPFTGSASVARHMRQRGWKVVAGDLMQCAALQARAALGFERPSAMSRVLQAPEVEEFLRSAEGRAAVQATALPSEALGPQAPHALEEYWPLRAVVAFLNVGAAGAEGLVFCQYSPEGPAGRGYFTPHNARRIDGVRAALAAWRRRGLLDELEATLLSAALLDAVDRVANISGTYGAFLKSWAANALQPFALAVPFIPAGPVGVALRCDAAALARRVECQVAYLDPPYNQRQYPRFFHVLEVLALLESGANEEEVEADLGGTTGLPRGLLEDRLSRFCMKRQRGGAGVKPAEEALRELLVGLRARHVVMSYTEEGALDREAVLGAFSQVFPGFDARRDVQEVERKRFRSDADRTGREYRRLDGRGRNRVAEWLIYARRPEPTVLLEGGQRAFAWAAHA